MNSHHFIGFDVHKKWIWYTVRDPTGKIVERGKFVAEREAMAAWCQSRRVPWTGLMEATMFTHWIYDVLQPFAAELRVGHPAAMKLALAEKNKADRRDADRSSGLALGNLVRTIYMMPAPMRALRRRLRLRLLLQRQIVQLKNRTACLLMEVGVVYNPRKLHTNRYYQQLLDNPAVPEEIRSLLQMLRHLQTGLAQAQRAIFRGLENAPEIKARIELLQSIPGVGKITALTWALEVGDSSRFPSQSQAVSYCGLVSAQNESAGKNKRGPLSKIRNKYLQHVLIEVGHLAPRYYWKLDQLYTKTGQRHNPNAAAIAVARKLVSYLLAVDRGGEPFQRELAPEGVETV